MSASGPSGPLVPKLLVLEKSLNFTQASLYEPVYIVIILQVPEYLLHVEKRLEEESERLLHYLDQSTKYVYYLY